jgi:hypothetical protein
MDENVKTRDQIPDRRKVTRRMGETVTREMALKNYEKAMKHCRWV